MPYLLRLLPLFFIASLTLVPAAYGQLSRVEKKLVRLVEENNAGGMQFLEQVVNINSGTMNFEGVRRVGEVFGQAFESIGFSTRWVDGTPFQRAGHLIAEYRGNSEKTLLLIGHLDTVFEPSSPFQRFEAPNDSTITGPGVVDMKGGNVIMFQALKALQQAGLLDGMRIIVVLTGDEESIGDPQSLARRDLIEAAKEADIAIGFEVGDGRFETLNVARRSSSGWTLRVTGTPSHSSQVFTEGVGAGAVYEASRILHAFYETLSNEPNLTFNPGVILGGTDVAYQPEKKGGEAYGKSNIVARDVIAIGDIRAMTTEQLAQAQAVMREIASKHLPGTKAVLTFGEGYPPMAPTEGNYKLLAWADQVSRDLGYGGITAVNPRDAGAADISFTAGHVDMAIDGLGLRGSGAHTVNEQGDPRRFPMQTKRAALLLYRIVYGKVK